MTAYTAARICNARGKRFPIYLGNRWLTCCQFYGLTTPTRIKLKKNAPKPNPIKHVPLQSPFNNKIDTLAIGKMIIAILQRGHIPESDKESIEKTINQDIEDKVMQKGKYQHAKTNSKNRDGARNSIAKREYFEVAAKDTKVREDNRHGLDD